MQSRWALGTAAVKLSFWARHTPPSVCISFPTLPGFWVCFLLTHCSAGQGGVLGGQFPHHEKPRVGTGARKGRGPCCNPIQFHTPLPISPHPLLSNPVSPACDAHLAAVHRLLPCCRMRGKRKQHQKDSWWSSVALTYLDPLPFSLSRLERWLQPARSREQNGNECE